MGTMSRILRVLVPAPKPFKYDDDDISYYIKITDIKVYDEYMEETNRIIAANKKNRAPAHHCNGVCCR